MIGKKIITILAICSMLLSAMIVFNTINENFNLTVEAEGVMGVDDFQRANDTGDIIHEDQDPSVIKYNPGVTTNVKFEGDYITEDCAIYKPRYRYEYDSAQGGNEYFVKYFKFNESYLEAAVEDPTIGLDLDVAGLWLIVADTDPPELSQYNMKRMEVFDTDANKWEGIVGWFWVNHTEWSVELSTDDIYYGRNDSLEITVKDESGDVVTDPCWVDIWKVNGDPDGVHTLVRHQKVADGTYDFDTYEYTVKNSLGAGIYRVSAYQDQDPSQLASEQIYGISGTNNNYMGYNSTFGSANASQWGERFNDSTANENRIRDWSDAPVDDTFDNTTYYYGTMGPFDPPEYWADYVNFTVHPGVPSFTVVNETIFWNSTGNIYDNNIDINVSDYDGNVLRFQPYQVELYNKSNKPSKSDAVPFNSVMPIAVKGNFTKVQSYYNTSDAGKKQGHILVYPNGTLNRWGRNATSWTTWAAKGKLYILVRGSTIGNASEEWNGTVTIDLVTAQVDFKWIDDDGTVAWPDPSTNTDGVIPYIPAIGSVPLNLKFQILGSDYTYYGAQRGALTAAQSAMQAAENITITGNCLYTGPIYDHWAYKPPGSGTEGTHAYYASGTWNVPIIPTMAETGGEITITVDAWNRTLVETLTIGGSKYWTNGSVVSITPDQFNIAVANKTLDIIIMDANGNSNPYATAKLYYIGDGTGTTTIGQPASTTWINKVTALQSGAYEMLFNKTMQTNNQTRAAGSNGAGLAAKKAPRNLTVYVDGGAAGYGYALINMKADNNLEVEVSRSTLIAGYEYESFYINTTLVGNTTETPHDDDESQFNIKILDENDNDVTATILSGGTYTANDIDEYEVDLSNLYMATPGTYTLYAYNNTRDSMDHNATITVEQVTVTPSITPLIWSHDENISVQFTATYNGEVIGGSILIDNLTDVGDYNQTWKNTSFDGTTDQGGNTSIEIDEDQLVNGQITIYDITAQTLIDNDAIANITFWFKPESPNDGAYARTIGKLPVQVPIVTPDKMYVAVGRTTTVNIDVTGRESPLADIYVRLHGQGVDTNTTSDAEGKVSFSVLPTSTGNISIDVGKEGKTTDTVIQVTSWILDVETNPVNEVDEGETFTVTVTKAGTTDVVVGASIKFAGMTYTTGADGTYVITAPQVTSDRTYTITVTADGYAPPEDTPTITVIHVPKLVIVAPTEVTAGSSFEATLADDSGNAIIGATITIIETGDTFNSGAQGIATITAPSVSEDTIYTFKASRAGFDDSDEYTITIKPGGIPGFEVLTLLAALGVAFILLRRRRH